MTKYNKLWAALVGVGLIWLNDNYGIDLSPHAQSIIEIGLLVATPLAVYLFPNKEAA